MGENVILKKYFFCIFVDIVAVIAVVPIPIIGAEKKESVESNLMGA